MADEVETMLADLERRLHALQAELGADEEHRTSTAPPHTVEPSTFGGAEEGLERFGRELRRLVAAFDRLLVDVQGAEGIVFRDEVLLEVTADLAGLAALHEALASVDGASAELLAYARGRGVIELRLDRGVALVSALRRSLRTSFSVLEAREGRLAIEVGSFAGGGSQPGA